MLMFLGHLEQLCYDILSPCILQFDRVASGFPVALRIAAIPKMILLSVQVNLVNHVANNL